MEQPIQHFWEIRIGDVKEALEANNFEVFTALNLERARKIVMEEILPKSKPKSVSWGGSMTVAASGIYDALLEHPEIKMIDTTATDVPAAEKIERRRRSLLVDLYFTGTNAVTEEGQLVNLDMIGNRIGGLTFGPNEVVVLAGRNKIVPDVEEAMLRIKNYVAPVNAMRLDMKTPCVKTGRCEECKSPSRICNTWTITEKGFPKGRVKVILINADLGL
jgi:hypothetical protein